MLRWDRKEPNEVKKMYISFVVSLTLKYTVKPV